MTTTTTDLDERARSLHAWDARIRLLTDYDAAREELAKTRAELDAMTGIAKALRITVAEMLSGKQHTPARTQMWKLTLGYATEALANPATTAEPADEPNARCCPNHREPGEARYGCATAPGVTDPCCNQCHYWIDWNRYLNGDDDEPAASTVPGDLDQALTDAEIASGVRPSDEELRGRLAIGTTAEPADEPKADEVASR